MGNFKRLGKFENQTGEKKRLFWLGKQPIFGLYKEGFFGPENPIKKQKTLKNHFSHVVSIS
jgi:hypothetical protein